MRHKAQYSTKQLRRRQTKGEDVFPVFGRYVGMPPCKYAPRTKFDPKPWALYPSSDNSFRYSAWELTTEPHKATAGELAEQRHEVEDTPDFVRRFLPCAGVAA